MRRRLSRTNRFAVILSIGVLVCPAAGMADEPSGDASATHDAAGAAPDAPAAEENAQAAEAADTTTATRTRRQHSAGAKTYDALVLRPIDFLGLIVSSVAFVPAAILASPTGKYEVEVAADTFVVAPAENVFQRRLGDF